MTEKLADVTALVTNGRGQGRSAAPRKKTLNPLPPRRRGRGWGPSDAPCNSSRGNHKQANAKALLLEGGAGV